MWRHCLGAGVVALGLLLASQPAGYADGNSVPAGGLPGTAIPAGDFLTQGQIRARMDFSKPLTDYLLEPTQGSRDPELDCAADRPETVEWNLYPAPEQRAQTFRYIASGARTGSFGRVVVLRYSSTAKARAAYARAKQAIRAHTRYTLVCDSLSPVISGQTFTGASAIGPANFTWRYHELASSSFSMRALMATSGRRVVWVQLGRQLLEDLNWGSGTPAAGVPAYPSRYYLEQLAKGAAAKAL